MVDHLARTLDALLEVAVLVDADMTDGLGEVGLTPARAHLLWELGDRGPSPQRALAEALGVSARNVTGLVDALERTGFVTREPHPTDRRASLVTFTEQGRAVAEGMAAGHRQFAELLFGSMPPEQLEAFSTGLGVVLETLRAHVARSELSDG